MIVTSSERYEGIDEAAPKGTRLKQSSNISLREHANSFLILVKLYILMNVESVLKFLKFCGR